MGWLDAPREPRRILGIVSKATCQLLLDVLVQQRPIAVAHAPVLLFFSQRVNPMGNSDDEDDVTTDKTSQDSLKISQNPGRGLERDFQRNTCFRSALPIP